MTRRPAYGLRMSCPLAHIFVLFFIFGVASLGWYAKTAYSDYCAYLNMEHQARMFRMQVEGQIEMMKLRYQRGEANQNPPNLSLEPATDCPEDYLPQTDRVPEPIPMSVQQPDCVPKG